MYLANLRKLYGSVSGLGEYGAEGYGGWTTMIVVLVSEY
jgi:hypothetical protein